MSPKQWLCLFAFYVSYLFFGATVFYHWEQELETERREEALQERVHINELLTKYTIPHDAKSQGEIFQQISDYCEKPVTHPLQDEFVDPYVWGYFHSFFFSFIVISTVGYGNISPNNTTGRMFMIFYALVGIPLNGMLYAYMGECFGRVFIRAYQRYKNYKLSNDVHYVPRKLSLVAQLTVYFVPGVLIFIFIPAAVFCYFEDWDYPLAVYYAFVTLTTIGFGDYVVTFQPHQPRVFGGYFVVYQIFVIFWVVFGLGYLVMVMGFVSRGIRSKRMTAIEHKLALSIKETQSKIWGGVNKDVGYLRRVLNEIYLMKFKPVYHEPGEYIPCSIPRSASCPDLTIYRSKSDIYIQRRAYSVCYGDEFETSEATSTMTLNRAQSDSDLSRIDRNRTFEAINQNDQPTELLAKVITALGSLRSSVDETSSIQEMANGSRSGSVGIHGLSDSQILGSEKTWSGWSLPVSENSYMTVPSELRSRENSEVRLPEPKNATLEDENEWTWSGSNAHIKEIKRQQRKVQRKQDLYRASFANPQVKIDLPAAGDTVPSIPSTSGQGLLNRLNPFKKRTISTTSEKSLDFNAGAIAYIAATSRGRPSQICLPQQYLTETKRGRPSVYSMGPSQQDEQALLETTTIADLFRAIEMLHTDSNPSIQEELNERTTPQVPSLLTMFNKPPGYDAQNSFVDRRRPSMQPTIYSSVRQRYPASRRQSTVPTSNPPVNPPPYTRAIEVTPQPLRRRFSVRPSALSIPPGQAPKPLLPYVSAMSNTQTTQPFQRKPSIRPSPLARLTPTQMSVRNAATRCVPVSLQRHILESRARHSSLSNLFEKNDNSVAALEDRVTRMKREHAKRTRFDSK